MTESEATIVLPLRRQNDAWLAQAVASALAQTRPTEVLVVTAADTPATNRASLARLGGPGSRLRVLERPPGAGFAEAINLGFREARCARVGLLLTDDWLSADAVEQCLGEDADIVATAMVGYDADGLHRLWGRTADPARLAAMPSLEERASYIGHFLLFRRGAVLAAGGVDPSIGLTGADDYDLIWTLLERGASVRLVPRELYHYRDHFGERLTLRDQADQIRDLRRILAKHGVGAEDTERLVAQKAKWYGVPGQVAIADPAWYLKPGAAGSGEGG